MSDLVPQQHLDDGKSLDIIIWEDTEPRSVLNLVPSEVREKFLKARSTMPDLFEMDEVTLGRELKKFRMAPTAIDNRIRLKFWLEYDQCQFEQNPSMNMSKVIMGLMSREGFYKNYLSMYTRVAWLLCPPTNYTVKTTEALEFGLEQMRDILEMDCGEGKKFNASLAKLKFEIVKMLDQRVHGSVLQKTMNLQVNTRASANSGAAIAAAMTNNSMESLNSRLTRLRQRERELENGGLLGGEEKANELEQVIEAEVSENAEDDKGTDSSGEE